VKSPVRRSSTAWSLTSSSWPSAPDLGARPRGPRGLGAQLPGPAELAARVGAPRELLAVLVLVAAVAARVDRLGVRGRAQGAPAALEAHGRRERRRVARVQDPAVRVGVRPEHAHALALQGQRHAVEVLDLGAPVDGHAHHARGHVGHRLAHAGVVDHVAPEEAQHGPAARHGHDLALGAQEGRVADGGPEGDDRRRARHVDRVGSDRADVRRRRPVEGHEPEEERRQEGRQARGEEAQAEARPLPQLRPVGELALPLRRRLRDADQVALHVDEEGRERAEPHEGQRHALGEVEDDLEEEGDEGRGADHEQPARAGDQLEDERDLVQELAWRHGRRPRDGAGEDRGGPAGARRPEAGVVVRGRCWRRGRGRSARGRTHGDDLHGLRSRGGRCRGGRRRRRSGLGVDDDPRAAHLE
jgi:hypothetical protein